MFDTASVWENSIHVAGNLRWHAPKQTSPNCTEREISSDSAGLVPSNLEVGVRPTFRVSSEPNCFCIESFGRLLLHQHLDRLFQQCIRPSSEMYSNTLFSTSWCYRNIQDYLQQRVLAPMPRIGILSVVLRSWLGSDDE